MVQLKPVGYSASQALLNLCNAPIPSIKYTSVANGSVGNIHSTTRLPYRRLQSTIGNSKYQASIIYKSVRSFLVINSIYFPEYLVTSSKEV